MEPFTTYRGYSIYRDEKGFYYVRNTIAGRWYFATELDTMHDIDTWVEGGWADFNRKQG